MTTWDMEHSLAMGAQCSVVQWCPVLGQVTQTMSHGAVLVQGETLPTLHHTATPNHPAVYIMQE